MKPRTQLRFLSIALFALWGRAGAETLPPFFVSPALLGPAPTPAAAPAVSDPAPAVVTDKHVVRPAATTPRPAAKAVDKPVPRGPGEAAACPRPSPLRRHPPSPSSPAPRSSPVTRCRGLQDVDAVAEGAAELRRDSTRVEGDKLHYFELTDEGRGHRQRPRDPRRRHHDRPPHAHEGGGSRSAPSIRPNTPSAARAALRRRGRSCCRVSRCHAPSSPSPATVRRTACNSKAKTSSASSTAPGPVASRNGPDWYIRANELELDYDRGGGVRPRAAPWCSRACRWVTCRGRIFRCRTRAAPACCRPPSAPRTRSASISRCPTTSTWRPTTTTPSRCATWACAACRCATRRATSRRPTGASPTSNTCPTTRSSSAAATPERSATTTTLATAGPATSTSPASPIRSISPISPPASRSPRR